MDVKEWLGQDNIIGQNIWKNKYCRNNETFEEWLDRVSGGYSDVRKLIKERKFLFGGRILSNRGVTDEKVTYSNCYVIEPPKDNIESIYGTRTKLARTYSYGGGCGIDISNLSPRGARVHNQAKETSGAVSFMQGYSMTTEEIGQNGRRGALMISLSCNHPDLEEFIDVKTKSDSVTKANISVRITDEFMKAVKEDKDWDMTFTRPETGETIVKTAKAKYLFEKLAKNNWDWAEPGILFWDTIERENLLNTTPEFKYAGTNPCAEEPLPAGGSCLLGALNLAEFVDEKTKYFKYNEFKVAVDIAVRALNQVLDEGLPLHPLQEQRDSVRDWRQIGLGIMGLADMLIKMEVKYDSDFGIKVCDDIATVMATTAIETSALLARTLGAYPKYSENVMKSEFYKRHSNPQLDLLVKECGLRNSQLLTIAPTGSISTMLDVSGGLEPIFANYYTRKTESLHGHDQYYKIYTGIVKQYMDSHNLKEEEDLPEWFVTSSTINPFERVRMQGTWQKHIDASISSTVNLPESTSVDTVRDLYISAWENGLKGMTIFRNNCKRCGILTVDTDKKTKEENVNQEPQNSLDTLPRGAIIECSDNLIGLKRKLQTGCGSLHVTAFFDEDTGNLQEVYLNKGSTGGCNNFMIGLSRTISLLCRAGVDIKTIKDQLDSTGACPSYATRSAIMHDTSKGGCCPMAIGNALVDMYNDFNMNYLDKDEEETEPAVSKSVAKIKKSAIKCPNCGGTLRNEGGCNICPECGWSKCD